MGKKVEHGHFAVSSSAGTSVFSYFRISELLVLWPSDSGGYTHRPSSISFAPSPFFPAIELELFHWVSWFSSVQTAHHGISQFPQSHQPIPVKLLL